ncbi:MAG TPA: PEP-CTERM sorting domain-containing protein [Steroidobacteraceae bacterium]|nr:PEP-CTERM sorting domain-containing protein [Steroidobacteraceae bacterium]
MKSTIRSVWSGLPRDDQHSLNYWGRDMKLRVIAILCASLMAFAGARPAAAADVLYDGVGFLQGQQSFVQAFNITGPGTLTITLQNVAWPETLANLNMTLSTASGLMGPELGAGTETFNVRGGPIYAQWFGTAQGPLDLGVYSLKVVFNASLTTPVPLPATGILLTLGLGILGWHLRRQNTAFPHSAARSPA